MCRILPSLKITTVYSMSQYLTLLSRLRKENLHAVDVGTVEDYQGRESRVCIVSCVRSRTRFLAEDQKKGLGLVFERKR